MTTNTHRTLRSTAPPSPWKTRLLRLLSFAVVVVIGVGVYLGVSRAERQECLNDAFRSSLNERAKATDDLIDALGRVNAQLRDAGEDMEGVETARQAFADGLARVEIDREQTKTATAERQEADCG